MEVCSCFVFAPVHRRGDRQVLQWDITPSGNPIGPCEQGQLAAALHLPDISIVSGSWGEIKCK